MAISFKELGKKAENLIEQGKEADQRIQSCQAGVSRANSNVAAAAQALEAASQVDEDGRLAGDPSAAAAQLRMAENQLEASRRALEEAEEKAKEIESEKQSHAGQMEQYTRVEQSNLEKLQALKGMAFGENSAMLTEGIAARLNENERIRVELLKSMGIDAAPEYVSADTGGRSGSGFGGLSFSSLDLAGQVGSYQGGGGEGFGAGGAPAPIGGGLTSSSTISGDARKNNNTTFGNGRFQPLKSTRQETRRINRNGREVTVFDDPTGPHPERICNQGSAYPGYMEETCGLCADGTLINRGGGNTTEKQMIDDALSKGRCESDGGTTIVDLKSLLDDAGMYSSNTTGDSLGTLAEQVEKGHGVIIGVNSSVFYSSLYGRSYKNGDGMGHALTVDSVVRDAETGKIISFYITDSNAKSQEFACVEVPMKVLRKAYRKSGRLSLVTNSVIW